MTATIRRTGLLCILLGVASAAFGDGMIVPTAAHRPVRGGWSVKYHHVNVIVRDQVASVAIDQAFVNNGRGVLEVEYLFPIPPGAAIDSMTLVVDGREMPGKLMDAKEARRIYEGIVRRKKDPALLEYAGFGLYRTRAFPLAPGKPVKVLVHYSQVCRKDRSTVEVWYPLNTEKFSAKPLEEVKVRVDIKSAADITAVYSPTHDMQVTRKDPRRAIATYHAKNVLPTEDLQVFYKAADEDVGATFLSFQPDTGEDGYFLLLVSPNPRTARTRVVAKDVAVVLDHSGSMSGKKLEQAKEAVRFILRNLNRRDRFNLIAYNSAVSPLFDELADASKARVEEAVDWLDELNATGGTNIHEALQTAVKGLPDAKRPGYVLFLTDGLPTVGNRKEADILKDTARANAADTRLFVFGVGYDVNVRLLDKLADQNAGRSDYVKPNEPIETKISALYAKIKNPVMTDLHLKVDDLRLRQMYPRQLGDLFEGDQIVLCGRYNRNDAANLPREAGAAQSLLRITGEYLGKRRTFKYPVAVRTAGGSARFAFVEQLWAVRRIGWLLDQIQLNGESKEVADELIRLSKQYGIITPYTSFLADESIRLADAGELRRHAKMATAELGRVTQADGQRGAWNRQRLNRAYNMAQMRTKGGQVAQIGAATQAAYEQGATQAIQNLRQIGNLALYRRGNLWLAANAAKLDPKTDADRIVRVQRFSPEYFQLIRSNTQTENRALATQRTHEQLLITLRGQAYMID